MPVTASFLFPPAVKKFRIREAKTLSTDADSSTAAKKVLSIFFLPHPGGGRGEEGRAKFGSE